MVFWQVLQSLSLYPSMLDFVLNVLEQLIAKQVSTQMYFSSTREAHRPASPVSVVLCGLIHMYVRIYMYVCMCACVCAVSVEVVPAVFRLLN